MRRAAQLALLCLLAPLGAVAQQSCAPCLAHLANGFTMRCLTIEKLDNSMRLQLGPESFVELPNAQILSIEQDNSPIDRAETNRSALTNEAPASDPSSDAQEAMTITNTVMQKRALTRPQLSHEEINRLISENGAKLGVDEEFIKLVVAQESGYNARARSRKGAQGLMQLMPATAAKLGVKDAYDERQNVGGGAEYLRYLLTRYDGDAILALAAYNAGEGAVARYRGVPPYAETRAYIARIIAAYNKKLREQTKATAAELAPTSTPATPNAKSAHAKRANPHASYAPAR